LIGVIGISDARGDFFPMNSNDRIPSDPSPAKRTIVIGDVHGCFQELMTLLKAVEVRPSDDVICVGDLVRKGPDGAKVLRWAMETPNVRCVLGNHEARLVSHWLEGKEPSRNSPDGAMRRQLGVSYNAAMDFIRSWPLFIEEEGFLVVHAGLDPRGGPVRQQNPHDLLTIRIPEGMKVPWYDAYRGENLVVFGHWANEEPVIRPNAIGLDTGCVYGGRLSAVILPERQVISVPAVRIHQKYSSRQ
jgi:diadenosine tetraphosphatase ApaH/serine/threonine PP2A family protein phosphatase